MLSIAIAPSSVAIRVENPRLFKHEFSRIVQIDTNLMNTAHRLSQCHSVQYHSDLTTFWFLMTPL